MNTKESAIRTGFSNQPHRWMWLAGAACATLAPVLSTQAGPITVNLTGNYLTATGGDHLDANLSGGGTADISIAGTWRFTYLSASATRIKKTQSASVILNGIRVHARAHYRSLIHSYRGQINRFRSQSYAAGVGTKSLQGSNPGSLDVNIPITFTGDPLIDGGATTPGILKVTVTDSFGNVGVQLDSYTYNVPDQTSTLALLAMGAGGVLALRRSRLAR